MSINQSTYLKYTYEAITTGTDSAEQLSSTDKYVYALVIGVNEDSASATTGNWVGNSGVTTTNKNGVKITSDSPFTVTPPTVGNDMIPVNLSDYYVAATEGDAIYVAYLEEVAQT